MDNTQNLSKRASHLRKRSGHTGVVCSRTTLEKYHEEAYCYSHDRDADCRTDRRRARKCGTRVAVAILGRARRDCPAGAGTEHAISAASRSVSVLIGAWGF